MHQAAASTIGRSRLTVSSNRKILELQRNLICY